MCAPFQGAEAPEGFEEKIIEPKSWIVFRHIYLKKTQQQISQMFQKIFTEFLPESGYKPIENYILDAYFTEDLENRDIMSEIWIAVEKR
jgi:AraC family transcriptional regulator